MARRLPHAGGNGMRTTISLIRHGIVVAIVAAASVSTGAPPPRGPRMGPPPDGPTAADPVSLATGLYVRRTLDLSIRDVIPIHFERVYLSNDTRSVAFGVGTTHSYDAELTGSLAAITLITEERGRVAYKRIDGGMGRDGARYAHWATRSTYWGSMLGWLGDRWGLVLRNGTRYVFRACGTRAAPNGRCTLVGILDAAGNELSFLRDDEGRLVKIETSNRRSVRLQYDEAGRITDARASDGTRVEYEYDGGGHLVRATRSDGTVHAYEYDARGLLVRMKDVAGMVVENEYDSDRRTTRQVVTYEADASGATRPPDVFEFHYIVEANRITRTEVVRPGGERHRLTFDEAHYVTQESWQYPDGRSSTIDYSVDAELNRVTSVVVWCTGADGATTSSTARVAPGMSHKRVAAALTAQCGVPIADD